MLKASVGRIEVVALIDSVGAFPASVVYPSAGNAVGRYGKYLDPSGNVPLTFASYLLRDGDTTILVDTGWGPDRGGGLMKEIAAAGVAAEDIDFVLYTHLHGDHTGWTIDRTSGKPNFPKATHLVPGADWAHATKSPPPWASFERDIMPLRDSGLLELIDGERTITPGITAVPTPGHTPGHTSATVVSGDQRGYVLGDAVITPIDLAEPEWPNGFDWDDDIARATRLRVIAGIDERTLVAAGHFPDSGLGNFMVESGHRTWRGFAPS
jgi:glyoxylase-like metal-dependent hydrolase (beta-lactamase superfamily II)